MDQNEVKEAVKRRRISKCSIERKKLFENEKNGTQRGKRDVVIRHISKRENGNRMGKIALLRERLILHPA